MSSGVLMCCLHLWGVFMSASAYRNSLQQPICLCPIKSTFLGTVVWNKVVIFLQYILQQVHSQFLEGTKRQQAGHQLWKTTTLYCAFNKKDVLCHIFSHPMEHRILLTDCSIFKWEAGWRVVKEWGGGTNVHPPSIFNCSAVSIQYVPWKREKEERGREKSQLMTVFL